MAESEKLRRSQRAATRTDRNDSISPPSAAPRKGPRRRDTARSKDAILTVTAALMNEVGIRRMTIEAVAAAAGVGKTTIYRWWRSKGTLALDAFEHEFGILHPSLNPDTGSLRTDLVELLRPMVESIQVTGTDRLWPQIVAEAQSDPELAHEIYSKLISPYRALHRPVFEAAAARGEISASFDPTLLLDALYGAYYHRLLLHHGSLEPAFFDELIRMLVLGARAM
jgi:AcrR family transcriptional regulator